jgi:hypothetical protein
MVMPQAIKEDVCEILKCKGHSILLSSDCHSICLSMATNKSNLSLKLQKKCTVNLASNLLPQVCQTCFS